MIRWISFEGGEGSGKTTLIEALKAQLEDKGQKVLVTREPGGVLIAERIREILLDPASADMDPMTEALLFAAARRQHLTQKVLPALSAGYLVLMDRFVDSSVVYQGYARGLGMDSILELNSYAIDKHLPDLTFLLDIDPLLGRERIRKNSRQTDRLDDENLSFHKKVREGFLLWSEKTPRIHRLDAGKETPELVKEILKIIGERS